jgi:hypothetical protein
MHIIKLISFIFLGLYLLVVGLNGIGATVAFVHPGLLGFFALVAGVFFLIRAGKCCCNECKSCDRHEK